MTMKSENCAWWGARLERGEITGMSEHGYTVASYERPGIISPPILDMFGNDHDVGESVIFFLFEDGDGRIIG